jgi:hypothetical protein
MPTNAQVLRGEGMQQRATDQRLADAGIGTCNEVAHSTLPLHNTLFLRLTGGLISPYFGSLAEWLCKVIDNRVEWLFHQAGIQFLKMPLV